MPCKSNLKKSASENYDISIVQSVSQKSQYASYTAIAKPSEKIIGILKNLSKYLPVTFLIIGSSSLAVSAMIYTPQSKGKFSESNNTVAHIFIACSFFTISTIVIQHFMKTNLVRDIHNEIELVENEILDKLQTSICFRKVRDLFFFKFALMVGTYLQSVVMFFVGSFVLKKFTICPLAYGLSIITDISCLYSIFCIDLIHEILVEINAVLKRYDRKLRDYGKMHKINDELPAELSPERVIQKIEILKQMYLSAWILTHKINSNFGWFFISYLIQQFIDLAADLFWLFLINHDDFNYKILCK